MLEIGSKTLNIEGVTVFADHADPNQFWYLPGPVQLARRRPDNRAAFTFIKYGKVEEEQVEGKGFLMFEVNLRLDPNVERIVLARLAAIAPDQPKLSSVPFDEGSVQCIALDLQGAGGTVAEVTDSGTFQAVEEILGASTPSLHGDNTAAFSLSLSQDGAIILEKVFEEKGMPIGVIYSMKYTALRPALDVEIKANFKRIYDHFSAGLDAQVYFVRAGIEAGFEKLVQDGAIEIKVINYSTAEDRLEQEKWALKFFEEKLLNDWFKPTLTPGQLQGGMAGASITDVVRQNSAQTRPTPTPAPSTTPSSSGSTNRQRANQQVVRQGNSEAPARVQLPTENTASATSTSNASNQAEAPPRSDTPANPASTGVNVRPEQRPSAANISTDTALVAFKLKYIKQIEEKTLTFRYTRQEAVQRTYSPQGFFGLIAQDLSREGHFIEVDGDDPFFRAFKVSIEYPFDLEQIGLSSAHVQLNYGNLDNPNRKQADFIIDKNRSKKLEWVVKTIPGQNQYDYQVQYHFRPDGSWVGEQSSYDLPSVLTKDRTLLIHPFDRIGFLEVQVTANTVDWSEVVEVEVRFRYESPSAWVNEKSFYFTEQFNSQQTWKLRLNHPEQREYTYQIIYRLKDGSIKESTLAKSTTSRVFVPNPFHLIEIEFFPLYFIGDIRMVLIDVVYEDLENDHRVSKRVRLDGSSYDSAFVRLHIIDPTKQKFKYRTTIVGTDNSMIRSPFIETTEEFIGIGDK